MPPTIDELHKLRRSVTMVETAARWSASVACLSPIKNPRPKIAGVDVANKNKISDIGKLYQRIVTNYRADAGDNERAEDGNGFDNAIVAQSRAAKNPAARYGRRLTNSINCAAR